MVAQEHRHGRLFLWRCKFEEVAREGEVFRCVASPPSFGDVTQTLGPGLLGL